MSSASAPLKMGYVVKMFPRLSETFILNEILELERRGVEVVIFSAKKPNEGRFHPQLARLKAKVLYLEDLDAKKWPVWLGREWPFISGGSEGLWGLLQEAIADGDVRRVDHIWWGAWVAAQSEKMGLARLHAHFATLPSTIAYFAHRVSGIPFGFTAHAKDIFVYTPEEHGLREKMAAAEFVVTPTDFNRRFLSEQFPEVDASKIKVIRNGVNLERFEDSSVERDPDVILGVGRLVPKKGFDDLLDACALLKQKRIGFRCVVVGTGPEADNLDRKRRELGLEADVTLTGAKNQEEVFELMRKAAVFCLPCVVAEDGNQDALPTVLLESLACGLPIVSTSLSGVPEIVDEGENGLLVPPNDPPGLADSLEKLLASSETRERFGESGREKARRSFDLSRNVAELLGYYLDGPGVASGGRRETSATPEPSRQRRVLYVCADRGIPFGGSKGAAIHVREFAHALHSAGYAPHVVMARRERGSSYSPPYPVTMIPKSPTAPFFDAVAELGDANRSFDDTREFTRNETLAGLLRSIHARAPFEVVYERYSLFGTAGRLFAKEAGVPYVLEVNAPLVVEAPHYRTLEKTDLAKAVERYLFATADHVITVSEALREYVLGIAPNASVTVVPNGVNVERFRAGATSEDWRRRVASDPDADFVVGFVGRVRPWHGVEHLIDAVGELARTDDAVHLSVVGQCGDMKGELVERCKAAGLEGRVSFVGPVALEEIPGALGGMDVLAAPYPKMDNFYFSPLKVFEYMAAGKPIVASAIGQIPHILADEQSALLTAPGDVPALVAALRRLKADAELRRTLGERARADVTAGHSWTHRIEDIAGILTQLDGDRQTGKRGNASKIQAG